MIGYIENLTAGDLTIGTVTLSGLNKVVMFGNRNYLTVLAEAHINDYISQSSIRFYDHNNVVMSYSDASISYLMLRNLTTTIPYTTTFDKILWYKEMGEYILSLITAYYIDNNGATVDENKIKEAKRLVKDGLTEAAIDEFESIVIAGSIWTQTFIDRMRDFVQSYSSAII